MGKMCLSHSEQAVPFLAFFWRILRSSRPSVFWQFFPKAQKSWSRGVPPLNNIGSWARPLVHWAQYDLQWMAAASQHLQTGDIPTPIWRFQGLNLVPLHEKQVPCHWATTLPYAPTFLGPTITSPTSHALAILLSCWDGEVEEEKNKHLECLAKKFPKFPVL